MVASKKVHCAFCRKKCTGNVLRYQDQYYHKQCFELEQQSESAAAAAEAATPPLPSQSYEERLQQQQQVDPRELRARTTGEASARPNLSVESAPSGASSTPPSTRTAREPIESEQNLLRPASSSGARAASSANQTTRVFTSHQASSHYTRRQDTYASDAASANGSPLGPNSRSSSRQNISVNANLQQQRQPATMMPSGSPNGGRLTSSQLNRAPPMSASNGQPARSATLPHSISSPANGFTSSMSGAKQQSRTLDNRQQQQQQQQHQQQLATSNGNGSLRAATCAGCRERILDGQALIALDLHWHVWCFKCTQCKTPLHGEYVAKDAKAYCERDYQKLFGITCVYCKRYITGKVLQAGEAHHFHPSCARCSKCGDPFVPGEEMYLQGDVTWHPRCGPNPNQGPPESSLMDPDDRSQLRASRAQSPSLSSRSHSRSASPFSYMSRQYGRASPAYADSEAVGDLSRVYTISYLNADPNQGYLRRPIEPKAAKSPQFSRPTSLSRLGGERSRCSSRSQQYVYGSSSGGFSGVPRDRSVPRGMYSVLSGLGRSGSSSRARSPSMMNEEAIQLAAYPSGQKPSPDSVPKIERDDFPAPPFPHADRHQQRDHREHHHHQSQSRVHSANHLNGERAPHGHNGSPAVHLEESVQRGQSHTQERASRPRSREIANAEQPERPDSVSSDELDPQFRKEEEELSKIANGIGKIFLQTLKEREKLRAWKRANLDPRNASRTPSATRELPSRLRYENPTNASPSRDMDRARPWEEEEALSGMAAGEHSPTRTRSSLGRSAVSGGGGGATPLAAPTPSAISSSYGYKVVQANRSTPRPGYGVTSGHYANSTLNGASEPHLSFAEQQRIAQARANDLLGRQGAQPPLAGPGSTLQSEFGLGKLPNLTASGSSRSLASAAHLRRSMPNVANLHHLHQLDGQPPKLYPYHLLATSNYRLPPELDRCHLERHLSTEEFQYIFHCDRLDFYRLPEWKRNELKRRARLF